MATRTNVRLKAYKNKALDSTEMRRRREEEGVQLRKAKREEQVLGKGSRESFFLPIFAMSNFLSESVILSYFLFGLFRCLKDAMSQILQVV